MDESKRSKILVMGLLVVIVVGAAAWILLEYTADIMVDPEHGKKFAAVYEKDCQSRYEPEVCRRLAAKAHVTCFKKCVKAKDRGGMSYDQSIYLKCLQNAEVKNLPE